MTNLDNMTAAKWAAIPVHQREQLRDNSGLTKQLIGLEGWRVEVKTTYGETRRFIVGKSTGWRPCHLEIKTNRSMGGFPAQQIYAEVRSLYKVR